MNFKLALRLTWVILIILIIIAVYFLFTDPTKVLTITAIIPIISLFPMIYLKDKL